MGGPGHVEPNPIFTCIVWPTTFKKSRNLLIGQCVLAQVDPD